MDLRTQKVIVEELRKKTRKISIEYYIATAFNTSWKLLNQNLLVNTLITYQQFILKVEKLLS